MEGMEIRQKDLQKLCIMNMLPDITDDYILSICKMYGEVIEIKRPEIMSFTSTW